MAAADVVERIESLDQLAARQVVVTKPLADAIAEHGGDRLVTSSTRSTPFGNFLLGWELRESLVLCADNDHGTRPHPERSSCLWPHYVAPTGAQPSMSAVETIDPREAVL